MPCGQKTELWNEAEKVKKKVDKFTCSREMGIY